jgi:hypothetical protein
MEFSREISSQSVTGHKSRGTAENWIDGDCFDEYSPALSRYCIDGECHGGGAGIRCKILKKVSTQEKCAFF